MPRRPVPANAGAVARPGVVAVAALLLVAGCSPDAVDIEAPELDDLEMRACGKLMDALPEQLVDQPLLDPVLRHGAAWGDPPIVLRCGVDEPEGFTRVSVCQIVNGVAWFIPEDQVTGQAEDLVMTTIGRSPAVEVAIPDDYFPPAAAMAQLSDAVKQETTRVERCG